VLITYTGADDGDDGPFFVTSSSCWNAFVKWSRKLSHDLFPAVRALADDGECKGTDDLEIELQLLRREHPGEMDGLIDEILHNLGPGDEDETATIVNEDEFGDPKGEENDEPVEAAP
jgi:hypothetical protein